MSGLRPEHSKADQYIRGTETYCVDYKSCIGGVRIPITMVMTNADRPQSLDTYMSNLTTNDTSLFLRQFWEVQANVYELAAGWIFWSHNNELLVPSGQAKSLSEVRG